MWKLIIRYCSRVPPNTRKKSPSLHEYFVCKKISPNNLTGVQGPHLIVKDDYFMFFNRLYKGSAVSFWEITFPSSVSLAYSADDSTQSLRSLLSNQRVLAQSEQNFLPAVAEPLHPGTTQKKIPYKTKSITPINALHCLDNVHLHLKVHSIECLKLLNPITVLISLTLDVNSRSLPRVRNEIRYRFK